METIILGVSYGCFCYSGPKPLSFPSLRCLRFQHPLCRNLYSSGVPILVVPQTIPPSASSWSPCFGSRAPCSLVFQTLSRICGDASSRFHPISSSTVGSPRCTCVAFLACLRVCMWHDSAYCWFIISVTGTITIAVCPVFPSFLQMRFYASKPNLQRALNYQKDEIRIHAGRYSVCFHASVARHVFAHAISHSTMLTMHRYK